MKKSLIKMIALLFSAAMVFASGSQDETSSDSASGQLSGKIVFGTNFTNKADSTITDLAKQFMADNPGVTVEIEGIKDIDQILKTRMAAGELPDVTPVLSSVASEDFALYFLPIDDLGYTDKDLYFFNEGLGNDGKLYTINSGVSYQGITYNKVAFKKAGIDKIPTTIEELYAAAEKLKAQGIIPLATVFKDGWPLNWYTQDFHFATANTGDSSYRNNLKNSDKLLSEDGGLLEAFDLLREMNQRGYLESDLMSANWDGTKRLQASGDIGMIFLGTWYPPQVVDNGANAEDLGMFPFPGTKALPQSGDWPFAVSKNSKNPELAKAFLKYMWEESRYADAVGIIPPLKGVKVSSIGVDELTSFGLPLIIADKKDTETTDILNNSELNLSSVLQEYMITDDPQSVIDKVNDIWAKTRKNILGN